MNKYWTRPALVLAALAVAAGAGGCSVDAENGVTLDGIYGITFDANNNACNPVSQDTPLGGGFYDAGWGSLGQGYTVYLLLENNLPSNSDASAGRLDSNSMSLESVEVSIDNSGPWAFLTGTQLIPTAGVVKSNGSKLTVPVAIIGTTLAKSILAGGSGLNTPIPNAGDQFLLDVRLRVHAKLTDGSEVKSNEVQFPITIANRVLAPPPADTCGVGESPVGCTLVLVRAGKDVPVDSLKPVQHDGWICVKPG